MTPVAGRRRLALWAVAVAFVVVPLLEIFVLVQVGRVIGAWWTVGLLILASVAGAWLIKREGRAAWRALTDALSTGRMPARELADGALILIGGTLMLTPGFVSDLVAVFLILPVTRPLARKALTGMITRRLLVSGPMDARRPGPGQGPVVRGEVVDDD